MESCFAYGMKETRREAKHCIALGGKKGKEKEKKNRNGIAWIGG